MKNIFKKFTLLAILFSFIAFSGCDELSQLTLNIPLTIDFSTSGTNTSLTEEEPFCLTSYEEWRDNQEDIESAKYLAASYWTLSASPQLAGNLSFSLYDGTGGLLFTVNLGNIVAADYLVDPFVLPLTEDQIQMLDNYLLDLAAQDLCFNGVLTISNITGQTNMSGEYELNGRVEIVLETEVNTD